MNVFTSLPTCRGLLVLFSLFCCLTPHTVQAQGSVTSFTLIRADSDAVAGVIAPGSTVNLSVVGFLLNVRADTTGTVGSVEFSLDSTATFRTENAAPFALGGDIASNYASVPQLATLGMHSVVATPYSGRNRSGIKGTPVSIAFTVVNIPLTGTTAPVPAPVPAGPTTSFWEGPYTLTIVPDAAAHLSDGRLLLFGGYSRNFVSTDTNPQTWTTIFNPSTLVSTEALITNTKHQMFCPGTTVLPDGKILVSGGSTSSVVSVYNPLSNTWSLGNPLKIPRGYHSRKSVPCGGHEITF
jgi:hypothetical protein